MRALEAGSNKRATAATAMNHTSSRSHAIFTLFIDGVKSEISGNDSSDSSALATGISVKFHLVDLAGSERAKKTQATGNRFKEGTAINMGLLSLGNVISALGDDAGSKHVPYRDSKLTRLLQDSLGGNSHTLMIACVSPADCNIDETLSTLRYADRARKIKNKPIVNLDDKNELVARLRRENLELRRQIEIGGGGQNGNTEELEKATKLAFETQSENIQLQSALMACQEEMGHMNEKLLISEASSEKMKTKLKELASEADRLALQTIDITAKDILEEVAKRIHEVVELQKDGEKKLDEHEETRFNISAQPSFNKTSDTVKPSSIDTEADELPDNTEATHRKKQNALATELANLNKVLAQKEQLANSMKQNDEKLKEVKQKYEKSMKSLEEEIAKLQKQKDELNQQQRSDSKSKIAEQRRIRIQELEHQMSDLRKKVLEQQRAIKVNEVKEVQLKKMNEEIRTMKMAKVKLIKQMKEDADRVRAWKSQKEREVATLKQTERKQQVKIAKMESLHTKRQNVLQRKMEEAQVAKKRLEEIINKQKASKAKTTIGKQGLAGAVERIRDMVNHELDVVISMKDATQSIENLMDDRKVLMKQLSEIQKKTRQTMTQDEQKEVEDKRKQVQADINGRNLEIQNLQKQIMQIKEEKQRISSVASLSNGVADKGKQWWDAVQTMTEAKLAIEHLFAKASDSMGQSSNNAAELKELKSLYDEACTNSVNLEQEIKQMKADHIIEVNSVRKEYEDLQCILLSKITNPDDCPSISEKEVDKFSEIHNRVKKMMNDCIEDTDDEGENSNKNSVPKKKKTQGLFKSKKIVDTYKDVDTYLKEQNASFTENEEESDADDPEDQDWIQTPLYRRIKQVREQNKGLGTKTLSTLYPRDSKRKSSQDEDSDDATIVKGRPSKIKRSESHELNCKCTTGCQNNRCSCVKRAVDCGSHCKCTVLCKNNKNSNTNNHVIQNTSAESDRASNGDIKEGDTCDLINATFDIPEQPKYESSQTTKNINDKKSIFSDNQRKNSIFSSPLSDRSPMTDVSNRSPLKTLKAN